MADVTTETKIETAVEIAEAIAVPAANVVAPFIGGATVQAIILLAAKYGPTLVNGIIALLKKKDVTLDDLDAAFAPLVAYEAFGIPDKVPTVPV